MDGTKDSTEYWVESIVLMEVPLLHTSMPLGWLPHAVDSASVVGMSFGSPQALSEF